jgi:hypothetical protein
MGTDAARRHAYCTPPGMRKRCVCAVFRSGGLSGNARAAMPRRGGRSRAAPGPYGPWPHPPRPVCLGVVWFWFVPFYKGPPGAHMHPPPFMHDFGRIANGYVCVVAAYVHTRTQLHGGYNMAVLRLRRGGSEPRHSAMQTPKNRCQRSPVLELYVSYDHKVRNYIGCWSITANMPL